MSPKRMSKMFSFIKKKESRQSCVFGDPRRALFFDGIVSNFGKDGRSLCTICSK